jgi:hypothetical protein
MGSLVPAAFIPRSCCSNVRAVGAPHAKHLFRPFGVGPGKAVEPQYVVKLRRLRLLIVNHNVLADHQRAFFVCVDRIAVGVDHKSAIQLIIIRPAMQQAVRSSSTCPVQIRAGSAGLKNNLPYCMGSNDDEPILCIAWTGMQPVYGERLIE